MKNEQRQASREIIAIVDAHHNYRIGNFEFDHTERTETQNGTIYVNCVSRDGKTPTYRFKVESINDKGYNLIWNGDIGIDWGGRVILEHPFDAECNPVNAIIEDNAGAKVSCTVVCEGLLVVCEDLVDNNFDDVSEDHTTQDLTELLKAIQHIGFRESNVCDDELENLLTSIADKLGIPAEDYHVDHEEIWYP